MSNAATAPTLRMSNTRSLGPWYAIEFLNSFGANLFTAGSYDYVLNAWHSPPSTTLWLSASWGLGYIFICLVAGSLTEKLGPRKVIGLMSLLTVFTAAFGIQALRFHSVWLVALALFFYNITSSMLWPAIESAITRSPSTARLDTRTMLYNVSWGSSGFLAFLTIGVFEQLWWGNVFLVPALCTLIGFILFFLYAIPQAAMSAEHATSATTEHEYTHDPQHAKTLLLMAWIANIFAYVTINTFIPIKMRLAEQAGITALSTAGMITAVWAFTRFLGFALVWLWPGWHYKAKWLIGAQIVLGASFATMLLVHNPAILITMQIFFGLAAALIYSSSLYYAMHVSSGHGGHAGIHEALIGLGIAVGPAVGALAGNGEFGTAAMARISISVSALLVIGISAMIVIALRKPTPTNP